MDSHYDVCVENSKQSFRQKTSPVVSIRSSSISILELQELSLPGNALETKTIRIHFPVDKEPSEIKSIKEETLDEILYDTSNFSLLPRYWLWKRNEKWILKIDESPGGGMSVFSSLEDQEAIVRLKDLIGSNWEDQILPLVCLKTTRLYVASSQWYDFTSWGRWKIGYYAVRTFVCNSSSVDQLPTGELTLPSKAIACLHDIMPQNFRRLFSGLDLDSDFFQFCELSERFITKVPIFGAHIAGYSSDLSDSSDDSE